MQTLSIDIETYSDVNLYNYKTSRKIISRIWPMLVPLSNPATSML